MSVGRSDTGVLATDVCWQLLRNSEVGRLAVSITGRPTEIERIQDVFAALDLPLFPWHASPKHRFVRIEPFDISGRRFHVTSRPATQRLTTGAGAREE